MLYNFLPAALAEAGLEVAFKVGLSMLKFDTIVTSSPAKLHKCLYLPCQIWRGGVNDTCLVAGLGKLC